MRRVVGRAGVRIRSAVLRAAKAPVRVWFWARRVWSLRSTADLRTRPCGVLAAALPEIAPEGASDRASMAARAIIAVRAGAPRAIWVDDAGHLDPVTASVFHHLVYNGDIALESCPK